MKRLFIISSALLLGVSAFAQNDGKVKSLTSKIEKSNAAIQDPKKGINPSTWMDRGDLFYEVYGVNVHSVRQGQPILELKLLFGDPKEIQTTQEEGKTIETYVYSRIKVNVDKATSAVVSWEETSVIDPKALDKSFEAYQKAASLDAKGKLKKKLDEAYKRLANDLEQKEFNEYALKHYLPAFQDAQLKIKAMDATGVHDTVSYYYSGYFAYMSYPSKNEEQDLKLAKTAEEKGILNDVVTNFNKALELNYKEDGANQGLMYGMLYSAYCALNDTVKGMTYLEKGFNLYPENQTLILTLLNYYATRNQSEKALDYVNKAKSFDPNNAMFEYVEGRMLDLLGRRDESIAAYDRAIALDPTKYEFQYNKGVVYYNYAVKLNDEASAAKALKDMDRLVEAANTEFEKAVEPMEKALELKPNDQIIMETLKTLYFRLRVKHPEMEAKYNDMVAKLKALGVTQ